MLPVLNDPAMIRCSHLAFLLLHIDCRKFITLSAHFRLQHVDRNATERCAVSPSVTAEICLKCSRALLSRCVCGTCSCRRCVSGTTVRRREPDGSWTRSRSTFRPRANATRSPVIAGLTRTKTTDKSRSRWSRRPSKKDLSVRSLIILCKCPCHVQWDIERNRLLQQFSIKL